MKKEKVDYLDFIDSLDDFDLMMFFILIIGIIIECIALFIWDYKFIINTTGLILLGLSLGYFLAAKTL